MRRWMWGLSLVLGLTVATTGCDKLKQMAKEKASQQVDQTKKKGKASGRQAQPGASAQAPGDDKLTAQDKRDIELGEKLNGYVECLNSLSSSVSSCEERYYSWADKKKGPTGKEPNVYGLYELQQSQVDRCTKEIADSKAKPPSQPEIEAVAAEYQAKVQAVLPKVAEAHLYYDSGEYKSDKLAKGKLLHKPLVEVFDAFEAADDKLRATMAKLKEGMAERELGRLERTEGKKLHYYVSAMMIPARALVNTGAPKGDAKVEPQALEKAIDQYAVAVRAMAAYATKNTKEAGDTSGYSSLMSKASAFENSARTMLEYVKGKKKYDTGSRSLINANAGHMVEGHPANFVEKFNDLITQSNDIHW
jgi:hypothetical protein